MAKIIKWGGKRKKAGAHPKKPEDRSTAITIYRPLKDIDALGGKEKTKAFIHEVIDQSLA